MKIPRKNMDMTGQIISYGKPKKDYIVVADLDFRLVLTLAHSHMQEQVFSQRSESRSEFRERD